MIERFTEYAQRAVHFGFQDAQKRGHAELKPVYLMLGLAQANCGLFSRIGISEETIRAIGAKIPPENPIVTVVPTMYPFGDEAQAIITHAAKEADTAGQRLITTGHLLLGAYSESAIIRDEFAKYGVTEAAIRNAIAEEPTEKMRSPENELMTRRQVGRSGIGYDLHRLEAGRKLMIGGVHVPFDKGPVGHSDGDVLAHAICDALLGAAGMGDIGTHFPDTDPKWKGTDSLIFLEYLRPLLDSQGLQIIHIDAVVIAERPKLGPHFPAMREALAKALGIETDQINLKAKTNEGVDAIGRGEAIAAHVVATVAG